jgi:hypothetical protein
LVMLTAVLDQELYRDRFSLKLVARVCEWFNFEFFWFHFYQCILYIYIYILYVLYGFVKFCKLCILLLCLGIFIIMYITLCIYVFCSVYSLSLWCSVYRLCVNVYWTTATGREPNCS